MQRALPDGHRLFGTSHSSGAEDQTRLTPGSSSLARSSRLPVRLLTPLSPACLAACSWTIPSNIPVSAFGGQSLFGLFTSQIGAELAHFPTGPSIDSPFWLYMVTWHMGLFACIFW